MKSNFAGWARGGLHGTHARLSLRFTDHSPKLRLLGRHHFDSGAGFFGSILFGVQPGDPATYLGVAVILIGVATVAVSIPARRAARIDPIEALRQE
jgi:ABC-type antimicrobial peptide transport system permease subunit